MIPFFYDSMLVRVIGNVKTYLIIYYLIRNSVETQTSALLFHMTWAQQSLHVTSDFWCSLGMPGHQWGWSCTVAMVMEKILLRYFVSTLNHFKIICKIILLNWLPCVEQIEFESSSTKQRIRACFVWHLLSLFSTNIRRRIVKSM